MSLKPLLHGTIVLMAAAALPAVLIAGFPDTREPNTTLVFTGAPGSGPGALPSNLAAVPDLLTASQDHGHTVPGVILYDPSSALWSDNSGKVRYAALPGLAQVTVQPDGTWTWPNQTLLIKNFTIALDERSPEATRRRIETRLLLKLNSSWLVYSYAWNEQETDATLVAQNGANLPLTITQADGSVLNYTWRYPSRSQCYACHTTAADFVLGPISEYLNHELVYPGKTEPLNQMDAWKSLTIFDPTLPPATELDAIPDYEDTSASLTQRAKAYLDSNCSYCHQPGGGPNLTMDHRWEIDPTSMSTVDVIPQRNKLGVADARIVYSGQPDKSVLLLRMESTESNARMPPVGTTRVDPSGTAMMREWITSLGVVPSETSDVWSIH